MTSEINIHCDTIAQFKALRHIQANFEPWGVVGLQLIRDGIRLTDITGAVGNFIYNKDTDKVTLQEES